MASRPSIFALLAALAFVAIALPCHAQERFELGDDGFKRVETPDPNTPEGELWTIRKHLADDDPGEAWDLADDWIEDHPNHPKIAEAYLLRGDAKAAKYNYHKALFDYEAVARTYPGSSEFETALERELMIAQSFARGVKRKLWGIRMLPAKAEAEELFIRIQERAPGKPIAERAGIELADYYYRNSQMGLAADAYDLFVENYPRSQWREYAMKQQVMANLATFKGPRFDATGLIEAQSRLGDYQRQYPAAAESIGADALLTRVDESLAERALHAARWYDKEGNHVSAVFMYKRLVSDHPQTASAYAALERIRELRPALFTEGEIDLPQPTVEPDATDAVAPDPEPTTPTPAEDVTE